jgi:hypothetical protein
MRLVMCGQEDEVRRLLEPLAHQGRMFVGELKSSMSALCRLLSGGEITTDEDIELGMRYLMGHVNDLSTG